MDGSFETTDPKRSRLLGVFVMASIALLQLATEYLGTRDASRFLSKAIALLVGLPLLIVWAFALFRWASRKRFGVLAPLFVGAVTAGLFFAGLLLASRAATVSLTPLRPHHEPETIRASDSYMDPKRSMLNTKVERQGAIVDEHMNVFPIVAEDARVRALEADKLRTHAELARLRSHLEPHFLLNTLNTIAGLVAEDPREARRLLGALGDLLRDAVVPDGEMQTLGEQIEWLRRYAHILEVRHAGHLAFHWQVAGGTRRALLPRLLLQPLVENAVKHGALMRAGGGEITVRTELGDGPKLICIVEDNGPGVSQRETRPGAFGLLSVRRRLALRYSDTATLRLESSPAGTRSVVELPLEQGSMP